MEPESDGEGLEVRLLLEAVFARYGYDLRSYTPASMRRRVQSVLARSGLAHLGELQHRIICEPEFFASVLDQLTVQVSDMFRDPELYRTLRARVIPMLRTYPLLKIWHAGCSAGEEAYASAIMLSEEGLYDRTQIYATDLSPRALERAKAGVYSAERAAVFAENHRKAGGKYDFSAYCTTAYDHIAMKESLRRNIVFFQHDLVSDHVFGEMHAVFCRNVFIYFRADLRARVIRKFAQSLCVGGFLCLGMNEPLVDADTRAVFEPFSLDERIYRYTRLG